MFEVQDDRQQLVWRAGMGDGKGPIKAEYQESIDLGA